MFYDTKLERLIFGYSSSAKRKKRKQRNPGYYKSRNKYLGKTVKDVGKKGLDVAKEYLAILRRIMLDLRMGKISKKTARGRLLLLYRLTFPSKNKKARNLSASTRKRLRRLIKKAMERL